MLIKNENVVLNFPFKECVLKGSQSKDDEKGKEIFFNEILARSEIDTLFAPKILDNFEVYGDADYSKIEPNLLIKGNNLLALHTLKDKFRSKVKLIYIDPPYNTGNDSFNYNDKFSHSTWLVFMKNRLSIAREFLRDDGVIFIQCDDNEQAYLKVLCDEIFGRENFVANLIWQKKKGGSQDSQDFAKEHEYILCYKKLNYEIFDEEQDYDESDFSRIINDKKAKILKLEKWGIGALRIDAPSLYYSIKDPNGNDFYPIAPNGEDGRWRKKPENLDKEHIFWQDNSKGRLTPYEVIYFDEVQDSKKIVKTRTIFTEFGTTTDATKEIQAIFGNKLFDTPKPEKLIQKIIEISTQENDLVMDFFAGSGTTLAVAMKMGRKFIGIEQMEYIDTITKERLKKVVDGEQGGISKAVEWSGGSGFIYAGLKELNEYFKKHVLNADEVSFESLLKDMKEKAFLNYQVDFAKFDMSEFDVLGLENKKEILLSCLDKNMDYALFSDIEDEELEIDEQTKKLNYAFYGA